MPTKILVADDSPSLLNMTKSYLSGEGYDVLTAQNGMEALEKVYQENPSLVILDVIMPEMTGYQVCRIMKDDRETRNIPIILLTALEQQKDKFWGLKTGADKYIPKTAGFGEVLIPEVRLLLDKFAGLPRTETFSRRKVDASEILSWVNSLLDKQLFESTIINEANNLAVSILDHQDLVKGLLLLINQLMRYKIGFLFLTGEKEDELWVRANLRLSENAMVQLRQRIEEEMKSAIHRPISPPLNINIISDEGEYHEPGTCGSLDEMQSYFSKALYLHNTCIGLFALADKPSQQFDQEGIHTCDLVLNQGLVAIENARLYKKTQELAITDGLTGIYNHRYFQEKLESEISRAARYNRHVSVIMIDIDHFKRFNDRYGHQAGDEVLQELAGLIRKNVRDSEIVARYGGEEFVVVAPEISTENAAKLAEKLRANVEAYDFSVKSGHPEESVTISLGVAGFPDDADNKVELISKADKCLYEAKKRGRNQVWPAVHKSG